MPRPGPRPYECVRRAWHSDRHKPLRGSIIQQIFRLVGEAHSEKRKSNREWQEKLPIVVLKCEEILYSKANTEAEYLNQGTLWDRVSDAVNTIIRLEEVNECETGKFLPPCIEAALTLGCVPVKSSRSQRHCNTRTYLTPRLQDPNVIPQRVDGNAVTQPCPISVPASTSFVAHNGNLDRNVGNTNEPSPSEFRIFSSGGALQSKHLESNNVLTDGLVYPLYYGTNYQSEERRASINDRKRNYDYSQGILIGRPVTRLIPRPGFMGSSNAFVQNEIHAVRAITPSCDLSLRLGVLPSMDMDLERNFPTEANNHPVDLSLTRWCLENTGSSAESSKRNNPPSFHNFMEDRHFSYQSEHPENQLSSPKKWLDL